LLFPVHPKKKNSVCTLEANIVNIDDMIIAREKMKGIVYTTPLDYSKTFSQLSSNEIYLKLENLQKTGSFKVRGSYNKLISLSNEELRKGVVAASAGNHAQGVAYSSQMLNVPCTIVMPKGAPLSKILATKQYGAEVVLEIIDQLPDVEAIFCPIGGGGLIAGLAMAVKEKNPHISVYGVQTLACPSIRRSIEENKPQEYYFR
jgi:threonine dehydratase